MKLENILFWILILSVIGISIWLAFGSPIFETSLIAIMIFAASLVILLWRALFSIDKRTAVGFEKVRSDFRVVRSDFKAVNNKLENINKELVEIKNSLKFKRK